MREQHPIDELFARTLRGAEAEPPPGALGGILRERSRRRAGWLRRWGWLPLLLLFGTGLGYLLAGNRHANSGGIEPKILALGSALPDDPANGHEETKPNGLPGIHADSVAPPPVSFGGKADGPAETAPDENEPTTAKAIPAQGKPAAKPRGMQPVQGTGGGPAGSVTDNSGTAAQPEHQVPSLQPSASQIVATTPLHIGASLGVDLLVRNEGSAHATWLPVLISSVGSDPGVAVPRNAPALIAAGPRRSWWVAAMGGQFLESRRWTGGEATIREALQATEPVHATTALGMLAGVNGRGGWSLAIGAEYHAGRYDFRHTDRFQTRHDSIFNHVITFNSLVLQTTTDTITTYRQEQRIAASVNRYAMLRIPLELGWHAPLGRFRLGARAGVALELTDLRSGTLLVNGPEGPLSVEVQPAHKQCMSVLGGSVGADLGYILTEQWSLWASPVYEKGLLSLLPPDNSPYALAERSGIRLRLAYTFRP